MGVILAGGKNSRMGSEKGFLEVGGKKIIERIIEELKQVVDEIIILSNGNSYNHFGYKVYNDIIKDCGPMGGIHTALHYSKTDKMLVISCDMPFISKNILKTIIERSIECEIAIPEHDDGAMEPLCAVYLKSCFDRFANLLESGEWKLKDAFKHFRILKINFTKEELSGNCFLNINTPEEYQKIKISKREYSH